MLLHTVMFFWAVLVALLCLGALAAVLMRGSAAGATQQPSRSLFDFSAGQAEGRKMQEILAKVLSESVTDAEFEQRFRMAIQPVSGLDAETSWAWFGRFVMEYREGSEFEASPRRLAERFLADIPRRYNL